MALNYLSLDDAKARLIDLGAATADTLPSDLTLARLLAEIEAEMNGWFGYCLSRTTYTESLASGYSTLATTTYYPVLNVISAQRLPNDFFTYIPQPQQMLMGGLGTVNLWAINAMMSVTYEAGYDPIPDEVLNRELFILLRALEYDPPDISFLQEFAKDVKKVALPGGLSKEYQSGASTALPEKQIDRIMKPLIKYQRTIIVSSSVLG